LARIRSGEAGLAYEDRMDGILHALRALPAPAVAVIEGLAVGGGLNIAAPCDLRIATAGARLGVPIARTVGDTLSMANAAGSRRSWARPAPSGCCSLGELLTAEKLASAALFARVARGRPTARGDDLIRQVHGSADLAEGTAAFLEGSQPRWQGR
jgi:enoyl-CoA hydratase/carnithine racemase